LIRFAAIVALVLGIVDRSAAEEHRESFGASATAKLAPLLRALVYADLEGEQSLLPKYAKIGKLKRSPGYQHGTEQLRRAIRDRPDLGRDLVESDKLWIATAYLFGGAGTDVRPVWSPDLGEAPQFGSLAHSDFESPKAPKISVAATWSGTAIDSDRLWEALVFELHNGVMHGDEAVSFSQRARSGVLSQEQYVLGIARTEFNAIRATRLFYVDVYLPWVCRRGKSSSLDVWHSFDVLTPDEYMGRFADRRAYPWVPYALEYDRIRAAALYAEQQFNAAVPFLERIAGNATSTPEKISAYRCLTTCRVWQKDYLAAMENVRKTLELQKRSQERADSHYRLGQLHQMAGDPKSALVALDDAKREGRGGPHHLRSLVLQINLATTIDDKRLLRVLCEEYLREAPKD
jgi:hypothetical protein